MEKFKRLIKKEILYYFFTFVILTLVMHSDMLSDPLLRWEFMQDRENYSHPFLYALLVYIPLLIIRKSIDFIAGVFSK